MEEGLRIGGVVGNDTFTDSSLHRIGFFCQLLIFLVFFNITGEESGKAYAVFIQHGTKKSYRYKIVVNIDILRHSYC